MSNNGTKCVHSGMLKEAIQPGAVTPIYPASAQPYIDVDVIRYPRYFNLPNQEVVAGKMAELEGVEDALVFSSGMAAISTSLFSFLEKGDHAVFQNSIYGGTVNLVLTTFEKLGIEYSFTTGCEVSDFEKLIKPNTKLIYIETPSNPLLSITDIEGIVKLGKSNSIMTAIDSTFASPILQNPGKMGIDIVLHSATKYLGGHSDICAGIAAGSSSIIDRIRKYAICFGGSLDAGVCFLLERSVKTLEVRVHKQTDNAGKLAQFLDEHSMISRVLYPGLPSSPNHATAGKQMSGFGGMISFEIDPSLDSIEFQKRLKLIAPTLSLGGVESTICSPAMTSHEYLSRSAREEMGVTDNLLRLSVGIESVEDLMEDIGQALSNAKV